MKSMLVNVSKCILFQGYWDCWLNLADVGQSRDMSEVTSIVFITLATISRMLVNF